MDDMNPREDEELIPPWVSKFLLPGIAVASVLSILLLLAVVAVQTFARLTPDGAAVTPPLQAQVAPQPTPIAPSETTDSSQTISATGVIGDTLWSVFDSKWVVANRSHKEVISPAVDIVPSAKGSTWVRSPVNGVVRLYPCKDKEGLTVDCGNVYGSRVFETGPLGEGNYGNRIDIDGDPVTINGERKTVWIRIAHCANGSYQVRNGDRVTAGTILCRMGSTGWSSDPHVHLEIKLNGVRVVPDSVMREFGSSVQLAMAPIQGQPNPGVTQSAQVRPQPAALSPVGSILRWLAGVPANIGDIPGKAAQAAGFGNGTSRDATVGSVHVTVVDKRTNQSKLDDYPDARAIAQAISQKNASFKGALEIALVDRVCDNQGNCYAGVTKDAHTIEIDPDHADAKRDGIDRVLAHELGHVVDYSKNIAMLTQQSAESQVPTFRGLTTKSPDPATVQKQVIDENGGGLAVLTFAQPNEAGMQVLKPQLEYLRQAYPWAQFTLVDVTKPEGLRQAQQYRVSMSPTTILVNKKLGEVWRWQGSIVGLEDMLRGSQWLGELLMASGQVPFVNGAAGSGAGVDGAIYAGVYGNLGSAVGTLGQTHSVEEALAKAKNWGDRVKAVNPDKTVVNVLLPTWNSGDATMINQIIAETGRRNRAGEHWYVMLNLEGGTVDTINAFIDQHITSETPHVGVVLDVEWFKPLPVKISMINAVSKHYFDRRKSLGLTDLGIFAVWYFKAGSVQADEKLLQQVQQDEKLTSNAATGIVVPIMDGFGSMAGKLAVFESMKKLFESPHVGFMGFGDRWGTKYDHADVTVDKFPRDALFWTQQ